MAQKFHWPTKTLIDRLKVIEVAVGGGTDGLYGNVNPTGTTIQVYKIPVNCTTEIKNNAKLNVTIRPGKKVCV